MTEKTPNTRKPAPKKRGDIVRMFENLRATIDASLPAGIEKDAALRRLARAYQAFDRVPDSVRAPG
jgi:hypothetical protein